MGRLLIFLLLAVLIVPALLLARLWRFAGQRRLINEVTLGLVVPTVAAEQTLRRWPARGRVLRAAGLLLGLLLIVALGVRIGQRSVFLWPLALAAGYLLGALAGEAARIRPRWPQTPGRGRHVRDYIQPALVWSLRAAVLLMVAVQVLSVALVESSAAGTPVLRVSCSDGTTGSVTSWHGGDLALPVLIVVALGWLLAELTLLRIVRAPLPAEPDDVPVDEALRSASAHVAVGAATVLTLLPLGGAALVLGLQVVGSCANSDVISISLIAGGLAALLAGLLVVGFLPGWLRPLQRAAGVRS